MDAHNVSVRSHCLSPTRAKVAIDAPLVPTAYARMFPELPSFQADKQFLHALGSAGGLWDCGDVGDSPESLGEVAAGWRQCGPFVAIVLRADRYMLRTDADTAELRNARSPQINLEYLS